MFYTHLGDAQLVYVPGMDPVVDPGSVPGEIIGSGNGTIDGPHLKADLRWSFFEEDCAWDPGMIEGKGAPQQSSGRAVCRTYPRGVIQTHDGGVIQFDAQGFAVRRENNPVWVVGSTVRFVTDAADYLWLTDLLATYVGTFNEQDGTAEWSFHAPTSVVRRG